MLAFPASFLVEREAPNLDLESKETRISDKLALTLTRLDTVGQPGFPNQSTNLRLGANNVAQYASILHCKSLYQQRYVINDL